MISSNKSPKSQNTLLNRLQRYTQASAIFRNTDSDGDSLSNSVQRSANAPTKAIMLSGPSTLPVGRTVDAQGVSSMPLVSDSFSAAPPASPMPVVDPVASAIEHVTQMQRSPESHIVTGPKTAPEQAAPTPPPIVETSSPDPRVVQAAPKSEGDFGGAWGRLQRIFKGHEEKTGPSQPTPPLSPDVQQTEMGETAVPTPPPATPSSDSVQRAVHAAESTQMPTKPKKAPLSSVWSVQQVEPEATSDEPIVMRQPDTPISTEPVQAPDEVETIRTKLGDVSSGRQTDSTIELHLPRRPRPAAPSAEQKPEDANKSFWDRMRNIEGKEPEAVQRTVDTEIGPLPADMWEILGETPPGTVETGGESTPSTIQAKPAGTEDVAPASESASEETTTGETAVPSFLAEAPTTQATPDAVQRAIAAAETHQPSTEPEKATTSPDIQRDATSAATPSTPGKAHTETDQVPDTTLTTSEPTQTTTVDAPAEPTIQRSPKTSVEGVVQRTEDIEKTPESQETPLSAESSAAPKQAAPKQATANETPDIQRAIAAAETSATPKHETAPQAEQTVQPKRSDAEAFPAKTAMAILPEPISQPAAHVDKVDAQETSMSQADDSAPTLQKSVDLNAETGPLPPLPDVGETAVSAPPQTPDTPTSTQESIQRAIAAAETTPPTENVPRVTSLESPASQPIMESTPEITSEPAASQTTTDSTSSEPVQRAIAAAETATNIPQATPKPTPPTTATSEPPAAQTAVSQPAQTQSSPEAIQRAVAAAETTTSTPKTNPEPTPPTTAISETPTAQTPVSQPIQTKSPSETVQRAIATAEATSQAAPQLPGQPAPSGKPHPTQPTERSETATLTPKTAVSQSKQTKSSPGTIQRAIAAAETSPTPSFMPKSSTQPQTHTIPKATTTLSPQVQPPTIQPSLEPTSEPAASRSREVQIQRAIAVAEMPATRSRQTVQRTPTAPQTAVSATTSTLMQDLVAENWHVNQETAVIPPAMPSPTITTTTTPSLMRALGAVESTVADETKKSTTEPTQETYQWPDIKPGTASPAQNNIQRDIDEVNSISETENTASPPKIDVDKLANEVYSQLRRRLAIEWERSRGKQ